MDSPAPRRPLWRRVTGSVSFHLAAAFLLTGLVLTFVAKPYLVPSGSMEQTLAPGDRILVNRLAYVGAEPAVGDVVVFDANEAWDTAPSVEENPLRAAVRWVGEVTGFGASSPHTLVKRVIAGPGQTAECCDAEGRLSVDGESLDEPYVSQDYPFVPGENDCSTRPQSMRCFAAVVVPDDSYLVLGDNRSNSSDSSAYCRGGVDAVDCWRWATRPDIVGKAAVILWPIARWGAL